MGMEGMMLGPFRFPMGDMDDHKNEPEILPEAQICRLREYAEVYHRPNPFTVGDLVTPSKGTGYSHAGDPHIVLEVRDPPIFNFEGSHSSASFGSKLDMRVAVMFGDDVAKFWVESSCFSPYTDDKTA